MPKIKLDDTIVAISTPIGEAGIGIVRLSGKDALGIVDRIFVSKDSERPSNFKTFTVHYGHIVENQISKIVDEVILTVMRAPKSYTREDVVEINCHSGIVPLKKILDLVIMNGARIAEPGEFTKRAFLNGRIDILQAEAVLDVIRAKTDLSLKAAINNLEGEFSKKVKEIRNELMDIFTHIEASIDFSDEEDVDGIRRKDIFNGLKHVEEDIEKLISTADEGKVLRQGIRTVICGSPNVGKSSLMNALLKESRTIVTPIPGTTRDTIEETVNIKGVPIVLIDTAGITKSTHPIQREGIKRSHFSIKNADIILFVLDYGRKLKQGDFNIIRNIKGNENIIIVINKKDLKKKIDIRTVKRFFLDKPLVYISALHLSGIEDLEKKIHELIFKGKVPSPDLASVSNDRQLALLRRSLEDVKAAIDSSKDKIPIECISLYIHSAIDSVDGVTGDTITEEALDRIFSEFCIGK